MKKKNLVVLAVICFTFFAKTASAQSFEEGTQVFGLGYGFVNLAKTSVVLTAEAINENSGGENTVKVTAFGPIFAKYEYGISDNIGIGANFAYIGVKASNDYQIDSSTYTGSVSFNSFSVLGRVNYHFANGDRVDPYLGVGVGYRYGGWKISSTEPGVDSETYTGKIPLGFEATAGIRVYVTDNIGLYSEIGIAKGLVQIGAVYKL